MNRDRTTVRQGERGRPALPYRPAPFEAGIAGSFRFQDFDEFAASSPRWEQRIQQLGRGRPSIRLLMAQTARVQIAVTRRDPGIRIEGTAPAATASIVLFAGGDIRMGGEWCRPRDVAYVPPGKPYDFHGVGSHLAVVASIDETLFERVARVMALDPPASPAGLAWPVFEDDGARRQFVRACGRWLGSAHRDPGWLTDAERARTAEDGIVVSLLASLQPVATHRWKAAPSARVAAQAEELLRACLDRPVAVWELAEALQVSLHTLHASFLARNKMTPKAYLRALRLDAARRELARAEPGTRVADVAMRWCFFHLGRFSAEFERAFGESPSEALRRTRQRLAR